MPRNLNLEIYENGQMKFTAEVVGRVVLGRQEKTDPEPYALLTGHDGQSRLLVARQPEAVSRQHASLEAMVSGNIRICNLTRVPLEFDLGNPLPPGETEDRPTPFTLHLPGRTIRVDRGDSVDAHGLCSLDERTMGPGGADPGSVSLALPTGPGTQSVDALLGWLKATLGVLQSTIGSVDFLHKAVEAMVTIVGLDAGRALLFDDESCTVVGAFPPDPAAKWQPSQRVLERVRRDKRTHWQQPTPNAIGSDQSLAFVQTLVVAPLLAADGRVLGALYGERHRQDFQPARPVGKMEAVLVDLLACGVSTGLARQEQERTALTASVRFEQFFTRELAQHLARQPDLLDGREAEVTVLFCDIRGFSRISERVGALATVRWVGSVMDELSKLVRDEQGVLVDYIGDEMMAMWGAPDDQPDHAQRAVRAALRFVEALPGLNERWQHVLGEPMDIGIGLNTGRAHVGNTGSQFKFKYGPLGNAVNLASRVQGLTKYLKCRLLVTNATRQKAGPDFLYRRVCRTCVVNIVEPVDVYEVAMSGDEKRELLFRESEAALHLLESRNFGEATLSAGTLLHLHPTDGPLRLTLSRAAHMLVNEEGAFDPVWEPPGKGK